MASIRVDRRRNILPAMTVLVLVFAVSFSRSGSVGHIPSTEEPQNYQEMKSELGAKDENEKDKSPETWTEWAKEKISGGLGLKNDDVKKVTDFISDNAKKAKENSDNVYSEAGQYGNDSAAEAMEKAAKVADFARETAAEKTTEAKDQAYNAAKSGKEKTNSLKNKAEESIGKATEKAEAEERAVAAEEAAGKRKIGEEYEAAKNKSQRSEAEDEL